jgi:hypothetical protein
MAHRGIQNHYDLNLYNIIIEAIYLALRWPVVGGFMGWTICRTRWIGLLGGRGGRNQQCPGDGPAVFGVLGPCAGVTTRSVRGRIVVLAADKHTKDRPISP